MKKQNKKVSVIMATYNTPKEYLTVAIDSMINQTYKNIEIIIVCDGNKEEYDYIKNKYSYDKRIITILNDNNMGLPYSLNKAIDIASGDYIARMDSDDISEKNRIEIEVEYMENNPKVAVVGMYARLFGKQNLISKIYYHKPNEIEIQTFYMSCLVHACVIMRKDYLNQNQIRYNTDFKCAQDFELWSRISHNGNIAIIPKVGYYYRMHNTQISSSKRELQKSFAKKIISKNASKLSDEEYVKECLLLLGKAEKVTKDNYIQLSDYIDKLIENNKTFDKKTFKKVLYNRFFHLLLVEKVLTIKTLGILKNKNVRNKVFKMYNINYIFFLISCYNPLIKIVNNIKTKRK